MANETVAPILPCTDVDETREFHESIGFRTTYCQRRPYTYLVVEQGAIALHFGKAPAGLGPAEESSGGAVVSVDEVAAVDRSLLLAHLVGLGVALGESAAVAEYREELAGVVLDGEEQERIDAVLGEIGEIREYAGD